MGRERALETIEVVVDGVCARVEIDLDESPLGWLARRRGRDGKAFIAPAQLLAGERLRVDFTRAQMTPRLTADWNAPARRGRGSSPGLTFSEAALAARERLGRAVEAVGPEFSGLLLDVCCFLKGLEEVERERAWPARTAKVVLALGLDRLARHYGLSDAAQGPSRTLVRGWTAPEETGPA
ncbi:DUF6456 domain-containing protein [Ancylobacter sp. SL191]|uniref:DUF6456 domain-containing protein n=1 Tax=Ancylobacter sp. SL191 TaxID=2995166 RepID=UPI0022711E75|nr:DUF6456 domain-containing protein [Ancylobacter sp. SL191]WAC27301.1 DUF6456 domain-containing protein [Ancylobacter sp. SL191]